MIVADALRADHLECYGYELKTAPHLANFAAESLVFEKALSNSPWTKPSIGSLLTSLYPHEHGAFRWTDNLRNSCLTLAEVFRNRNYRTYALQTNSSITRRHNFHQGFDIYEELIDGKAQQVSEKFCAWLRKNKKRPFFAYLHLMDTHIPYNAPDEFSREISLDGERAFSWSELKTMDIRILSLLGISQEHRQPLVRLYDAAIRTVDECFERIIAQLKNLNIFDNTLIIFTSDHGEEFWEHGGFAHGHNLYNETLRVPLILKYGERLPRKRIGSYVQLLDVFPVLLNLAGIQQSWKLRGRDFLQPSHSPAAMADEIFIEAILFGSEKKAVLNEPWKLIENTGQADSDSLPMLGDLTKYAARGEKSGFELYKISEDSSEQKNVADVYTRIVHQLKKSLLAFRVMAELPRPSKVDTKKREGLKSLGYIR
jgi:arylsulfatase A-like enzyme